jgi:hypothetical protein
MFHISAVGPAVIDCELIYDPLWGALFERFLCCYVFGSTPNWRLDPLRMVLLDIFACSMPLQTQLQGHT